MKDNFIDFTDVIGEAINYTAEKYEELLEELGLDKL